MERKSEIFFPSKHGKKHDEAIMFPGRNLNFVKVNVKIPSVSFSFGFRINLLLPGILSTRYPVFTCSP